MNKLVTLFGPSIVLDFSNSTNAGISNVKIVVKSHFQEEKRSGVKYFILDKDFKIVSEEMSQSWQALEVWFKLFKKCEVLGKYDFNLNKIL